MWGWILKGLAAIEDAERAAADLRRRYGAEAEAWCEDMLANLPRRDRRRGPLLDVRRALRWTPDPSATKG